MKISKALICLLPFASVTALAAPDAKKAASLKTDKEKAGYIIGSKIAGDYKQRGIDIDFNAFILGFQDTVQGKKSPFSAEEEQKIMSAFETKVREKMEAASKEQGEKNVKIGKDFLAKNAKEKGVIVLPSGLQYKVLKDGNGVKPAATDTVVTHYRGTLIDGTEFDSSLKRNEPATFPVNAVIKGWTEALQLMKVGSKWQLFVPPELGYGARGAGPIIGPNSVLVFEVELLSIKAKDAK